MAEIHVEKKRGIGSWVWVLLILIVLIAVGVYLWQAGYIHLGMTSAYQGQQLAIISGGGFNGA